MSVLTEVQSWSKEIEDGLKRERDWRKAAGEAVGIYEGGKKSTYPFNILYSNTETFAPALYNSVPRPVVSRRFKDNDPVGLQAALLSKRVLQYLMDDNGMEGTTFDGMMKAVVLDALIPGRGVTKFQYLPKFTTQTSLEGKEEQVLIGGTVGAVEVPWDQFITSYAKKWSDVTWVAYLHKMSRAELVENFPEYGKDVPVTAPAPDGGEGQLGWVAGKNADDFTGVKFAEVWEIWDKEKKEVLFICKEFAEVLKQVEDPLKLEGFFPSPKPLMLFAKITDILPITLYSLYEEQAKELNGITTRIRKLIAALKVRGMYDATVAGIDKVISAEDNTLIPAENVASMQQGQSLESAIWLMPLDKIISALQQLYSQREQVKQIIYEITGIADIMRGASSATETLGAQQLKSQWGTLRQKRMQKMIIAYARDCMRIMLEVALNRLGTATIKKMTNSQLPSQEEQQLAQTYMQAGQQPPPQVQQLLSQPSLESVLAMLQDAELRNYRIDIETNSTIDLQATEDKEDIGQLLNALAQFFSGIGPLVENGSMPFGAAKEIMMMVSRRYRFGDELEGALEQMQAPNPQPPQGGSPPPNPAEVQAQMAKAQVATQTAQTQLQAEGLRQKGQMQEAEFASARHAARMQELAQATQLAIIQHEAKVREIKIKGDPRAI
jgi:hypothetical protein